MGGKRIGRAKVEALLEKQKNALDLGGSTLKGRKVPVDATALSSAGTYSVSASESGTIFLVDNDVALTVNLPTPQEGLEYMFICTDAGTEDVAIKATTNGSTAEDIMTGLLFNHTDAPLIKNAVSTITFKDDVVTVGAYCRVYCIGTGVADGDESWFAEVYCDADGGITMTAED